MREGVREGGREGVREGEELFNNDDSSVGQWKRDGELAERSGMT